MFLADIIIFGFLVLFLGLICPYSFYKKIHSRSLKVCAIVYCGVCPFFFILTSFKGIWFGFWFPIFIIPFISLLPSLLTKDKFQHSEIKIHTRALLVSYAMSPMILGFCVFYMSEMFEGQTGVLIAIINLGLAQITIPLAAILYLIFLMFSKTENYKKFIAVKTPSTSE